jgi:hypothetical protein
MTAAKSTMRRRRAGGGSARIPAPIAAWFAGERRFTWYAYAWPWRFALPVYWRAWHEEHPGAVRPAGLSDHMLREWPPGSPMSEVAAHARARLGLQA